MFSKESCDTEDWGIGGKKKSDLQNTLHFKLWNLNSSFMRMQFLKDRYGSLKKATHYIYGTTTLTKN